MQISSSMGSYVQSYGQSQRPPQISAEARQELFTNADADGSGGLSKTEMQAFGESMKTAMDSASGVSRAKDGQGAPEMSDEMFAEIDTDGSGEVSTDELDAFEKNMQKKGPPPPPPAGSGASQIDSESTSLLDYLNSSDDEESTSTSISDLLKSVYSNFSTSEESSLLNYLS